MCTKATTMKLLVSHQTILQECMRVGGFTHYLIIIIVRFYLLESQLGTSIAPQWLLIKLLMI